jgi:hypothetical protein
MKSFPSALKKAFLAIRSGDVRGGMKQLDAIEGFDAHKAIARAEVAYMSGDWKTGMDESFAFLPSADISHYINITEEHIQLITIGAYETKTRKETIDRFNDLLAACKKNTQVFKMLDFSVETALETLQNDASLKSEWAPKPAVKRTTGRTLDELIEQQERVKPKLTKKPVERAEYLLSFLCDTGTTADFISVYEPVADKITSYEQHLRALREYVALGKTSSAQATLDRYLANWMPFEHMQVEPVALLLDRTLTDFLTPAIRKHILAFHKGENN